MNSHDYFEFYDDEDDDSLSEIYCDFCQDNIESKKRMKCSNCKHIGCIHNSRKVLLTSLGEKLPRWLCNNCLHTFALKCNLIKRSREKT